MVYAPQRRHAVASLGTTTAALALVQHLYTPNTLVLISRVLVQTQIKASALSTPRRSLLALFTMISAANLAGAMLHLLDFLSGYAGGKGLILDFVGQAHAASMTRVLFLDFAIYLLQVTSLVVWYITGNAPSISSSGKLPYADYLLPRPAHSDDPASSAVGDRDVEAASTRRRKSRRGYFDLSNEEEEGLWLNDTPELSSTPRFQSTNVDTAFEGSVAPRLREPPLIFDLSLPYLVRLIVHLPVPTTPRAFSGGTPDPTPPVTPGPTDQPLYPHADPPSDEEMPMPGGYAARSGTSTPDRPPER